MSEARAGGFFWLMTALTGTIAMVVFQKIVVFSDAAKTAANIAAQESLFRAGIAADLVATICYLAATLYVYEILKPVHKNLSLLAAFFSITGCCAAAATFIFHLAPLVILGKAPYLSAFTTEQLQALVLALLRIRMQAGIVSFLFFGLHCFLVGYLIFKSTFLPRFVGVLMLGAGLGWLTFSLSNLLAPGFGRLLSPYIMLPGALGEISLTLWLLVKGVNVQRWKEQTA